MRGKPLSRGPPRPFWVSKPHERSTILYINFYTLCQSGHDFFCVNSLLSMLIWTQLYLYQFLTINVNLDTILSVPIPNLYLSFKKVIQDASRSLNKKNYSHTEMKAEYFPTECILGSILQVKLINEMTSFALLYTSVVKLITIQVWCGYLHT